MTQKTKNILKGIGFTVCILLLITAIPMMSIIYTNNNTRMEPITNFIDVELEKGETCRLEILLPIGKTSDGVGTIFADEGGEMWIMNDFYAEGGDVFVALMSDKGTEDKTDDVILDIWLDLE